MEAENTVLLKKVLRPSKNVPVVLNAGIKFVFFQRGLSSDPNLCLYSFPLNSRAWRRQAIFCFFYIPLKKSWPIQEWDTEHVADLQMVLFVYLFILAGTTSVIDFMFSLLSYSTSSVTEQWLINYTFFFGEGWFWLSYLCDL